MMYTAIPSSKLKHRLLRDVKRRTILHFNFVAVAIAADAIKLEMRGGKTANRLAVHLLLR